MPAGGDDSLGDYRDKRDPARSNEPFSAEQRRSAGPTRSGRFVVHLHAATRTHYDLRLQVGGALESFAVPKGPSLDPDDKHLAVRTEVHPLDYLDFEDVIPEDNYGAGPMIVWDQGTVRYLDAPAEVQLERGKLDFELSGYKLRGRFALIDTGRRMKPPQPDWLLVKKSDEFATPGRSIIEQEPHSVLSGLLVDELAERERVAAGIEQAAADLGAPVGEVDAATLEPMLCADSGARLDEADRLYELKLDGARMLAERRGAQVILRYRNGRVATDSYPEIARAIASLAPERVVLDGEIVAFDEQGRPALQRLMPRIQARRALDVRRVAAQPVVYCVFDVLQVGGRDLTSLPLSDRKSILSRLIVGRGLLRALDHIEGDGRALFDFCRERELEGLVAKRAGSRYRSGVRSGDWVKLKRQRDDEFVVVGWVTGKGSRSRLGALDLASYAGERLVSRGKVGSGLDQATLELLESRLAELEIDSPAFEGELPYESGTRHFVRPELVVSVRYLGFSEEGRLREPVFRGVRHDVEPRQCTAAPTDELVERADDLPAPDSGAGSERVWISNRDKVFWPAEGYTKGDLCDYYAAVAPVLLPFLKDRPVVLVRYPDGIEGKSFFQWNAPPGTPSWIRTLQLHDDDDPDHRDKWVFLVDDADSLLHIANLGCIPIHVLASREQSLDQCDFLAIDLDIGEQPFRDAVVLALSLRDVLAGIGLPGYPKTSGQSGLHVLVPLGPGVKFGVAKILGELVGRCLQLRHPDISTMERRVSERGPRVYIDTGQTGRSRTIVAPYSVRARAGATVSTPLRWDEVHLALDPSRFSMFNVLARIEEQDDPYASLLDERPDVVGAVARLEALMR